MARVRSGARGELARKPPRDNGVAELVHRVGGRGFPCGLWSVCAIRRVVRDRANRGHANEGSGGIADQGLVGLT